MGCLGIALPPSAAHFPSGKKAFQSINQRKKSNEACLFLSLQRTGTDWKDRGGGKLLISEAGGPAWPQMLYLKDIEVRSFALGRPSRPGFSYLPDAGGTLIKEAVLSRRGPFIALGSG